MSVPRYLLLLPVGIGMAAALAAVTSSESESPSPGTSSSDHHLIAVAPPPFSDGVFPCSECHFEDDEVDRTSRPVDFHDTVDFHHDAENRWCLDCHDAQNRDMLHLADGRLVAFEESYVLCGQCHSPQLKDWQAGDHGRRTGSWSGQKEYLLCAHCHDPHDPSIKPIAPMPPPIRQENIK